MKSAGDTRLNPDSKLSPDEDGVFGARTDVQTYVSNLMREYSVLGRACLFQLFIVPALVFAVGHFADFDGSFWALFSMLALGIRLLVGVIGSLSLNSRLCKYDNEVFMRTIIFRLWESERKNETSK